MHKYSSHSNNFCIIRKLAYKQLSSIENLWLLRWGFGSDFDYLGNFFKSYTSNKSDSIYYIVKHKDDNSGGSFGFLSKYAKRCYNADILVIVFNQIGYNNHKKWKNYKGIVKIVINRSSKIEFEDQIKSFCK